MNEKKHIQALIWFLSIVWAILLVLDGFSISISFFKPISTVIGIAVIAVTFFEKLAWKLKWLYPWFVDMPNISGTWQGYISSNYVDENSKRLDQIEVYFIIRQTLTSIDIRMITAESSSDIIVARIYKMNGTLRIGGIYMNIPKQVYREKSPIHYGGLSLEICINSTIVLEGSYWTDRKTQGDISFKNRRKIICSTFEDCRNTFSAE